MTLVSQEGTQIPLVSHIVPATVELLDGGVHRRRDVDALVLRSFHAHVLVVVFEWKSGAVKSLRPREAEALQHGIAPGAHVFAQAAARSDGVGHLLRTHGHVHRAQKQLQLGAASVLDQRRERLEGVVGLLLQVVAAEIGHPRHVVAESGAHLHADGLACPQKRFSPSDGEQKQYEEHLEVAHFTLSSQPRSPTD
jgi:hypothetical protein